MTPIISTGGPGAADPNERYAINLRTNDPSQNIAGLYNQALPLATLSYASGEHHRKRGLRKDVIKRVALALYLLEKGEADNRRTAAIKGCTTTEAMNEYEDLPDVKDQLVFWKANPDEARLFQKNNYMRRARKKDKQKQG